MSFVDYKGADEFASFPEVCIMYLYHCEAHLHDWQLHHMSCQLQEERKQASFDQLLEVAAAEKAVSSTHTAGVWEL